MKWAPFYNWRETTVFRGFLLNAVVIGFQMVFMIYLKEYMDNYQHEHKIKYWTINEERAVLMAAAVSGLFVGFIILRLVFGYGACTTGDLPISRGFWA